MKTIVYLVRHGEVEYRYNDKGEKLVYGPDAHLSKTGIEQIEKLAAMIKKQTEQIPDLYSSPFVRARETAAILAKSLGIEKIVIEDNLRDIYTPGQEQVTMKEMRSFHQQESLDHLVDRISNAISNIIVNNQGKTLIIVCHGDPLRVYIGKLLFPQEKITNQYDKYYLGKGEAWRLVFYSETKLINTEKILNQIDGKSVLA